MESCVWSIHWHVTCCEENIWLVHETTVLPWSQVKFVDNTCADILEALVRKSGIHIAPVTFNARSTSIISWICLFMMIESDFNTRPFRMLKNSICWYCPCFCFVGVVFVFVCRYRVCFLFVGISTCFLTDCVETHVGTNLEGRATFWYKAHYYSSLLFDCMKKS